jgi:hypothetical protein
LLIPADADADADLFSCAHRENSVLWFHWLRTDSRGLPYARIGKEND